MSRVDFLLPDLGEGIDQAEVVSWKAKPGDHVTEHEVLVEVETDKALVELPVPVTGTLIELGAPEGGVIKLGELVAAVDSVDAEGAQTPVPAEPVASVVGNSSPAATAPSTPAQPAAPPAPAGAGIRPLASPAPAGAGIRPLASPAVRQLARDLGLDLVAIAGSGPGGRIVREDLEGGTPHPAAADVVVATAEKPALPAPVRDHIDEQTRIPLRGLRRTIARKMAVIARTVPNVLGMCEVDITELGELMNQLKPLAEADGVRLTWTALFALATVQALKEFPQLNASLDEEREEIIQHHRVHLGIAVAAEDGLLVPVVRNADSLSLLGLAAEIDRVSKAARARSLPMDELTGSTFTLTNYGAVGGWYGTPLVNIPEIGIVGFGAAERKPAVVEDQIAIRTIVALSHAVDHRLIDGAVNASFGSSIRRRLEQPNRLLLGARHGNG
jgi:pyruvate dehydrogenase E2 component (dihydrolipoamide acetyltransferase)